MVIGYIICRASWENEKVGTFCSEDIKIFKAATAKH